MIVSGAREVSKCRSGTGRAQLNSELVDCRDLKYERQPSSGAVRRSFSALPLKRHADSASSATRLQKIEIELLDWLVPVTVTGHITWQDLEVGGVYFGPGLSIKIEFVFDGAPHRHQRSLNLHADVLAAIQMCRPNAKHVQGAR